MKRLERLTIAICATLIGASSIACQKGHMRVLMSEKSQDGTNGSAANPQEIIVTENDGSSSETLPVIITNMPVSLVAPYLGAASYEWSQISGDGPVEFSDPNSSKTRVQAKSDGEYQLQVKMVFGSVALVQESSSAGGNSGDKAPQNSQLLLVWDTKPPELNDLKLINEASDGEISAAEVFSAKPAVELKANGMTHAFYSGYLDAALPVTCDGTKTYDREHAPAINTMVQFNGPYVVCVRIADEAGNVAYGRSHIITRNVINRPQPPTNFNAGFDGTDINLSWNAGSSDTIGYVLVRGEEEFTFQPIDGVSYSSGISDGAVDVIAAGSSTAANDTLLNALFNYYAVYAYNAEYNYSLAATASSVTGRPLPVGTISLINEAADGVLLFSELNSNSPTVSASSTIFTQFAYSNLISSGSIASCDSSQTYSASAPTISSLVGNNGNYIVCVRGADAAGHVVYGASPLILRNSLPQQPQNFSMTPALNRNTLTWTSGGGEESGYMIVRSTSPVTFTPSNGVAYQTGSIDANQTIVAMTDYSFSFTDSCFDALAYHYAVFAFNTSNIYSTGSFTNGSVMLATQASEDIAAGINYNACISQPVDMALIKNSEVNLGIFNTMSSSLDYEFEVSSSKSFATRVSYSLANIAAAASGSFNVPAASLTHGNIYWWRMRYAPQGSSQWSAFSKPRSFRIDNSLTYVGWNLESFDQMNSVPAANITDLTLANTTNGELYLPSDKTVGFYKSPAIDIRLLGWSRWGMGLATWYTAAPNGATNQYSFQIEAFDTASSTWALIPEATYPGNVGTGLFLGANLDAIDPVIYPIIRFSVRLWRDSTSTSTPKCMNLILSPRTASQGQAFVNAGFENTNGGEWVVSKSGSDNDRSINLAKNDGTAHSGSQYSYLQHVLNNNVNYSREFYISQTVDVPVAATSLVLWRKYYRDAWGAPIRFFIQDVIVDQLDNSDPFSAGWTQISFNVTAYQGQTITLGWGIFDYYWAGNGDHGAWVGVDDVTFQ